MYPFFKEGSKKIPNLAGVKYVDSDQDDYFHCQHELGKKFNFLFAPEPKLSGIGLGAESFVVAESYLTPWTRRMAQYALLDNNMTAARNEDFVRNEMASAMHIAGPSMHKFVLSFYGIDLGPNRLPQQNSDPSKRAELKKLLDQSQFFQNGCDWPHQ
jgi:N-acetylneuraminate lyase